MIRQNIVKALAAGFITLPLTNSYLHAESIQQTVILVDTAKTTRWAAVHQKPDIVHSDPYYHVEIFEHQKGDKPWAFKRLAHHMVITPEAMEKSRNDTQAKTYAYKDVEFWITYKQWRNNPESRARKPICKTTITECLEHATEQK